MNPFWHAVFLRAYFSNGWFNHQLGFSWLTLTWRIIPVSKYRDFLYQWGVRCWRPTPARFQHFFLFSVHMLWWPAARPKSSTLLWCFREKWSRLHTFGQVLNPHWQQLAVISIWFVHVSLWFVWMIIVSLCQRVACVSHLPSCLCCPRKLVAKMPLFWQTFCSVYNLKKQGSFFTTSPCWGSQTILILYCRYLWFAHDHLV